MRVFDGQRKQKMTVDRKKLLRHSSYMEKAPQKIKRWLSDEGRKVGWLATAVGVDQASLSRWINGHQTPRRENRVQLSQVTSLDVSNEESWL